MLWNKEVKSADVAATKAAVSNARTCHWHWQRCHVGNGNSTCAGAFKAALTATFSDEFTAASAVTPAPFTTAFVSFLTTAFVSCYHVDFSTIVFTVAVQILMTKAAFGSRCKHGKPWC